MIDKATKILIAKRYIEGIVEDDKHSNTVQEVIQKIFVDASCLGTVSPLATAFTDLVAELLGEDCLNWVDWWIYETNFGTKPYEFSINSKQYTATDLSIEEFLSIAIV